MFKSTYGYTDEKDLGKYSFFVSPPIYKVDDFKRKVEVFKIGMEFNADEIAYGNIYCLKLGNKHIPFGLNSSVESYISIKDLRVGKYTRKSDTNIPVINVEVHSLGVDLKSINVGFRGKIHYANFWGNTGFHGYNFDSIDEKIEALSFLQQALPVLLFDDYDLLCYSMPYICTKVGSSNSENYEAIDNSGALESSCLDLKPIYEDREFEHDFFTRMEEKSKENIITIEEFMSEYIILERGMLFYANSFDLTGLYEKLKKILYPSYNQHHNERHSSFDQFFHEIINTITKRIHAREVYEHFNPLTNPEKSRNFVWKRKLIK